MELVTSNWILRACIAGIIGILTVLGVYTYPPRKFIVSERVLRSGVVIENSNSYRRRVGVFGRPEWGLTGELTGWLTRVEWDNGEEKSINSSFPLCKGGRIEMIERIVRPLCLPSLRETYLKYNGVEEIVSLSFPLFRGRGD